MADKDESVKTGLSFGFSKKINSKKLQKSVASEDSVVDDQSKDFVTSLEGKEVKSTKSKEDRSAKKYVIPLIKENKWRTPDKDSKTDDMDEKAAQEIIQDASKSNENWDERGGDGVDPNLQVPLLMRNKVPAGYETDDKLDVGLRPDAPDNVDYEEIPIDHFGKAMLRGMGWEEGKGIGKNEKEVAPYEAVMRPKGLGLGAEKKNSGGQNGTKSDQDQDQNQNLELKKGSHCTFLKGPNKDQYGTIEGIDGDNARVMVKVAVTGKTETLSQFAIKLVSKKEFDKYSKYINKGKVDRYKEKEKSKSPDRRSSESESDRSRSESPKKKRSRSSSNESSASDDKSPVPKRKRSESREKSRSPSRDKSASLSKEKSPVISRKESRSSSKEKSASRERSRSASRERSRSASKERSRSASKERSRSASKEKSRSVSQKKSRSASRKKSTSKERSRSGSKKKKSTSKNKSVSRSRSRSKSRKRTKSRSRSRSMKRGRKSSRKSRSRSRRRSRSDSRSSYSRSRSRSRSGSRRRSKVGRRRRSRSHGRYSRSHSRSRSRDRYRRYSPRPRYNNYYNNYNNRYNNYNRNYRQPYYPDYDRRRYSDYSSKYDRRSKERRDSYRSRSRERASGLKKLQKCAGEWVRCQMKVRIVDKELFDGEHFKEKVTVEDIVDKDKITCKTNEGKLLENIPEAALETVIPKSNPAYVIILYGKHKGLVGEVIKRDKDKGSAMLELLKDRGTCVKIDYDSVTEFVGEPDSDFFF